MKKLLLVILKCIFNRDNDRPSGCYAVLVIKWYMVSKMKTECYSTHFLCISAITDLVYRIPTNSLGYFFGGGWKVSFTLREHTILVLQS